MVTPHTGLTDQEARCIALACKHLADLHGGIWKTTEYLDEAYPAEPSPEVIVGNDILTAAIEVKRLRGHAELQAHKESLLSLSRTLIPSCGGSYVVIPPSGFKPRMQKGLRREVARQIEEVAPTLQVENSGVLKISRQGYLVFRDNPTRRDAYCIHNDGRSLLSPLLNTIPGDLFLIDDRDPEHSFITDEAKQIFLGTLESAWREGRCSNKHLLTWYEEWQIIRTYNDDDEDNEVRFFALSTFSVPALVKECLDTMISKALVKFSGRRWADLHIIVLDVETSLMSANRTLPVIAEFDSADFKQIDSILLVHDALVHQAYPSTNQTQ